MKALMNDKLFSRVNDSFTTTALNNQCLRAQEAGITLCIHVVVKSESDLCKKLTSSNRNQRSLSRRDEAANIVWQNLVANAPIDEDGFEELSHATVRFLKLKYGVNVLRAAGLPDNQSQSSAVPI